MVLRSCARGCAVLALGLAAWDGAWAQAPAAAAMARPAKPAAPAPQTSLLAANQPVHAPAKLAFPDTWNGQPTRLTFTLTSNGAGPIFASLPPGPFWIAEFRDLGPAGTSGSLNGIHMGRSVKNRVVYPAGTLGPVQLNAVSGSDLQVDLVFEPKFQLGSMMAGPKASTFKVSGPGLRGPWTLLIPVQGVFNGLRLQPLLKLAESAYFTNYPNSRRLDDVTGDPRPPGNPRIDYGVPFLVKGTITAIDPIAGTLILPNLGSLHLKTFKGSTVRLRAGQAQAFELEIESTVDPGPPGKTPPMSVQLQLLYKRVADPAQVPASNFPMRGQEDGTVSASFTVTILQDPIYWQVPYVTQGFTNYVNVRLSAGGEVLMKLSGDRNANLAHPFTLSFPTLGRTVLTEQDWLRALGPQSLYQGTLAPGEFYKAAAKPPVFTLKN